MYQRPGGAAGFVEHIINFSPRRLDLHLAAGLGRLFRSGITGQIGVEPHLSDACAQALRQAAETFFHLPEPLLQVICASVELRVRIAGVLQAFEITVKRIDAFLVNIFRGR